MDCIIAAMNPDSFIRFIVNIFQNNDYAESVSTASRMEKMVDDLFCGNRLRIGQCHDVHHDRVQFKVLGRIHL